MRNLGIGMAMSLGNPAYGLGQVLCLVIPVEIFLLYILNQKISILKK